jgi:hypothetical protein
MSIHPQKGGSGDASLLGTNFGNNLMQEDEENKFSIVLQNTRMTF